MKSALNEAVSQGRGGEVARVPGHSEPSERTIGVSSAAFVLVKRGHRYVRLEAAGNVLNVPSQPPEEHYDHIKKTARK